MKKIILLLNSFFRFDILKDIMCDEYFYLSDTDAYEKNPDKFILSDTITINFHKKDNISYFPLEYEKSYADAYDREIKFN